jgi:L-2-hydroxyglutarate oxidase
VVLVFDLPAGAGKYPCGYTISCAALGDSNYPDSAMRSFGPTDRFAPGSMTDAQYDILIIGGGIVGSAVGLEATRRFPQLRLAVLEKEASVGQHQTGHNSGVIHSGVYYKPGSLKARTCVEGAAAMIAFCREQSIPYEVCGKIIVATTDEEAQRLNGLEERGRANGLEGLRMLRVEELREREPHVAGLAALLVPSTGITDYKMVCEKYAELIRLNGGEVLLRHSVTAIHAENAGFTVETSEGAYTSKYVINCAGLFSDRISQMAGVEPEVRIIPFRGEYYDLIPVRKELVRGLIYPVPDPRFPFLGVHFTRRIHGKVDAGPNAVFAFKREGYGRADFSLSDTLNSLSFPGFWRMAGRYWKSGLDEQYRSVSKAAFVTALQKLVPEIRDADLVPGGSGVRAQAITRAGALVDDFQFAQSKNMLHVYNVPSPAATASLAISRILVNMAASAFGWDQTAKTASPTSGGT